MTFPEKFIRASGHNGKDWVCGRCKKVAIEDVEWGIVNAKIIMCPHCSFPIPNKQVDEAAESQADV